MTMTGKSQAPSKIFRVLANLFVATVCGLAFTLIVQGIVLSMADKTVRGSRDFVVFWATGEQLAHHANPYDPVTLLRIERAAGLPNPYGVMYMRNLPFALPLVYPLGFLSLQLASAMWTLLLAACLAASVYMLWLMHGRPKGSRHWLGYSFGPALICLLMGQSTILALFGLVLFLRFHRSWPFVAGISLWLCMLKPQLFLPFGMVLLAWIVVSRSYRILIGAGTALAASLWITYLIDPMAWIQYTQMAHRSGIQMEYIPCISVVLRFWISKGSVWLQYVPAALACVWALGYFWPRRRTWDWVKQDGSLLMLVSLVTAPYSWIYDGCIVIPALLHGAYVTRLRSLLVALAFMSALIEAALFGALVRPSAIYHWTIWSAPAWLIWYLVACTPATRWAAAWSALRTKKWFRARPEVKKTCGDPGELGEELSSAMVQERIVGEEQRSDS
jgi:hypothetical protein